LGDNALCSLNISKDRDTHNVRFHLRWNLTGSDHGSKRLDAGIALSASSV